jgi:PAS domain S-box-containing protein
MYAQNPFFEEILELVPAEIMVADADYRFLYVNPFAVPDQHLREWMIGKTNEEFCQYAGRPAAQSRARRMVFEKARRTRRTVEWAESAQDTEGVVQHFQHRIYPVFDEEGKFQKVIIYVVRITEKKEFEEKVKLSEKRYRDIFNHSQALICTHDLDGRLLSVNPAICRVLGYEDQEMLGHNILEFIPEKNRPMFQHDYIKAIRDAESAVSGEFSVLNKAGQEIYLLYKNYKREEEGLEPYVIGFAQDITERIQMERELRLTKQLTDEVARAKESFLAHMSHEIRTPMNGILGIASLLNKTRLDSQQRNYLQLIQESANNLLVIVNDILDLEKIVAGKLQLEQIPFKIVDKIAKTIQSFIYRAEEKELGLIFQNSIPGDLVVEGDPYRLSQVLNNILGNALKFTEEGHINITTAITAQKDEEIIVEITVQDTGIGIGEDHLKIIFEPFGQANATISRKYGGTGLGLAISKNMIDMQNGELLVESEEGKGSAFTIRLPYQLSKEDMQEMDTSQEIDYKSLGKRKILVAEDVELNQYLARHILESWGIDVVITGNGREALEALEGTAFDCILMDVQMPEMDGIEATQHIRRLPDPHKSNIPIIALTANALKGDSEKYLSAGMTDYLAKPFDEARLFRVISRNLNRDQDHAGSAITINNHSTEIPLINNNKNMTPANARLYDLTMVESVSGGDEGFIRKMVVLFIETVPQNMLDLQSALKEENWDLVGKTAHKLKSTIDSMGIKSIRQEIRTVEANAKGKQFLQEIPALVTTIDSVIKECIGQLQAEILK